MIERIKGLSRALVEPLLIKIIAHVGIEDFRKVRIVHGDLKPRTLKAPTLLIIGDEQQKQAVILISIAYAPAVEKIDCKILDIRITDRRKGYDAYLRTALTEQVFVPFDDVDFRIVREYVRIIEHIKVCTRTWHIISQARAAQRQRKQNCDQKNKLVVEFFCHFLIGWLFSYIEKFRYVLCRESAEQLRLLLLCAFIVDVGIVEDLSL